LKGSVFEDKVIQLITTKAKISTKVLSKDELLKIFNDADQEGRKDQDDKEHSKKTAAKIKKTSKK